MTGLSNVQTPRSPQGLKGEISLIFSEADREIGESIHESLMRSGFKVIEESDGIETGISPTGTALYLAAAGTPKAIAATSTKAEVTSIRRQLSLWRALFAAATIGLIAFMGVSGALYQQNQSANRDLLTAIEQRDTAIAERRQMNDRLYEANVTTDRALAARDTAIAERQQMNDRLYEANVTTDRALQDKARATAERQQMNDKLYEANVMADRAEAARDRAEAARDQALFKQRQLNDELYVTNNRVETLQKELDRSNQRNDLLEELLRNRPVQSGPTSPVQSGPTSP